METLNLTEKRTVHKYGGIDLELSLIEERIKGSKKVTFSSFLREREGQTDRQTEDKSCFQN